MNVIDAETTFTNVTEHSGSLLDTRTGRCPRPVKFTRWARSTPGGRPAVHFGSPRCTSSHTLPGQAISSGTTRTGPVNVVNFTARDWRTRRRVGADRACGLRRGRLRRHGGGLQPRRPASPERGWGPRAHRHDRHRHCQSLGKGELTVGQVAGRSLKHAGDAGGAWAGAAGASVGSAVPFVGTAVGAVVVGMLGSAGTRRPVRGLKALFS